MGLPQAPVTPTTDVTLGLGRPQAKLPVEKATRPEVELPAKDASIFFQNLSNSASVQYLKFITSPASPRLESQSSFLFSQPSWDLALNPRFSNLLPKSSCLCKRKVDWNM